MATNLRLRPDAAEAVKQEAHRTGRSQQEVIRDAVDRHLGLSGSRTEPTQLAGLASTGTIRPPRTPYRKPDRRIVLRDGMSSADLLDRDERI